MCDVKCVSCINAYLLFFVVAVNYLLRPLRLSESVPGAAPPHAVRRIRLVYSPRSSKTAERLQDETNGRKKKKMSSIHPEKTGFHRRWPRTRRRRGEARGGRTACSCAARGCCKNVIIITVRPTRTAAENARGGGGASVSLGPKVFRLGLLGPGSRLSATPPPLPPPHGPSRPPTVSLGPSRCSRDPRQ